MEMLPPAELADLADDDVFLLAANGDARSQEVMCHRLLAPLRATPQRLEVAELWASMAATQGHKLSYMTIAQICAARGTVYALAGQEEPAVENLAQALAMFDKLAADDEPYSVAVSEVIFAGLKMEGCESIHEEVLRRAKEMQAA